MKIKVKASASNELEGVFEEMVDTVEKKAPKFWDIFDKWIKESASKLSPAALKFYSTSPMTRPFIGEFVMEIEMEAEDEYDDNILDALIHKTGLTPAEARKLRKAWF